jgi:TRAP-type mannitol/chloroaromatic compound transport system permease small subunit
MTLLKLLLRAIDRLSMLVGYSVAVLVPLMILSLVYEVVSRYFFHAPTLWAQDTSIFLFGYIGLLGGAFVMKEHAHINVDLIYARLSLRARAGCDVISGLVVMFFLILVVIYCGHEGLKAIHLGLRRPTDWAPPVGHFILAIAVGGLLLLLQTFAHWIRNWHLLLTGRPLQPVTVPSAETIETRV